MRGASLTPHPGLRAGGDRPHLLPTLAGRLRPRLPPSLPASGEPARLPRPVGLSARLKRGWELLGRAPGAGMAQAGPALASAEGGVACVPRQLRVVLRTGAEPAV